MTDDPQYGVLYTVLTKNAAPLLIYSSAQHPKNHARINTHGYTYTNKSRAVNKEQTKLEC